MTTAFAQTAVDAAVAPEPALTVAKLDAWANGFFRLLPNLAVAAVVLLIFIAIAWGVRAGFRRWAHQRGRDNLGEVLGSFIRWMIITAGALIAITIVLPSVKPGDLLAGLGVGSVAIGFAFKDILQNWLAGLLLLLRQPFEVGDQIIVNGYEGTVQRIETRATDVLTYDGRRVLIPNSDVYTNALTVNTAYEKRRSEYDLGIGYGDNIGQARDVILKVLGTVEGVERDPPPEVLPWALDASWVTLRIWWWTHSRRADVLRVRSRVIEEGERQSWTRRGSTCRSRRWCSCSTTRRTSTTGLGASSARAGRRAATPRRGRRATSMLSG